MKKICFLLMALAAIACNTGSPAAPRSTASKPAFQPRGFVARNPPGPYEIRLHERSFVPPEERLDWSRLFAGTDAREIHAIVQLFSLPDRNARAALAAAGIVLGQPLTGKAYLATVRRSLEAGSPALKFVRWTGTLPLEDKIARELLEAQPGAWFRRVPGHVELAVKLFPDADFLAALDRIEGLGAQILGEASGARTLAVSVAAGRERVLAALDAVRFLEPLTSPGEGESDRARVHVGTIAGPIPAGSPNGNVVVVGVFDSMHADATHTDFGGRVAQGDPPPANPANPTNAQASNIRHATMTAGMIVGDGTQSVAGGAASARQWRGLAPGAQARSYSFTNAGGDAVTDYLNDVTDAVTNDGVQILNNSWGDPGCAPFAYGSYAGRAPFEDGVVHGDLGRRATVVFSAGNERSGFGSPVNTNCIAVTAAPFDNYTTINHPKGSKNALIVGAIDSANDAMTTYSSWGPTLDGRLKPDIVASGQHNGTMQAGVSVLDNPFGNPTGAANQQGYRVPNFVTASSTFQYAWFDETSNAAAMASGALALLIDAWRTTFPGRPDPLPSTLRAFVVHNARDLDDATTWYNPGPDYASGYGLLQVDASVQSLQRGEALEGSIDQGETLHFFLEVPAGATQVKVTLAWDDPPAQENANPTLINDLDLVVRDPAGNRRFPWTLDPASPAAAAVRTGEDHANNLEQVFVDGAAVTAGTWQVDIVGTAVAAGPQSFSVVAQNGPVRRPVDLILALDTSSSMSGLASSAPGALTKIALLRQAVSLFLNTWQLHAIGGDRIGLATFSSNVTTVPNAVPALEPFLPDFAAVDAAASGLNASGCTAMGGALQVAFDSFDPASPNKRSILLFTDGMQSANPFVGEAGAPSRLRIQSFAANATLPFGAFFCTNAAATGPSGPIVPDGRNVDQHGAQISTIGVGVNGAGFQQVLERLADESFGVHHFTTAPDANLDLFYTNDLVRALKSNTLEVIATDSGTLDAGASKDISFPVNPTARSVTVVLSWRGPTQPGSVQGSVTGPAGAALVPDRTRQQGFFTLLKFDLPGAHGASAGSWRLSLGRQGSPAALYQVSVIAEEGCLHYDFSTSSGPHRVGEPLKFSARVSAWGLAPSPAPNVRVTISMPAEPPGNLLSEWLPKTKVVHSHGRVVRGASLLERALTELSRTPAFLSRAARRETREVVLSQSAGGAYAAAIPALRRPGSYDLLWQVEGKSACGPVLRQELATLLVRTAAIEPGKSPVLATPSARGTVTITVRPADAEGNLLGPGMVSSVSVKSEGLEAAGPVVDRFDGTYAQVFKGRPTASIPVTLTVDGKTWTVSVTPPHPAKR
jgi:hypothetical protein